MKGEVCKTKFCRNRVNRGKFCDTCYNRKWRKNNPIKYAFNTLRTNAKRRGKVFELSLDEFKKFCFEFDYIRGKGKTSTSYSIDRIDDSKGYTVDNIQILSLSDNTKKRFKTLNAVYNDETRSLEVSVTENKFDIDSVDFDKLFDEGHKNDCECGCSVPF